MVEVLHAATGRPAATAGLADGDVIVSINGIEEEYFAGLSAIREILKSDPGKGFDLEVIRDGQTEHSQWSWPGFWSDSPRAGRPIHSAWATVRSRTVRWLYQSGWRKPAHRAPVSVSAQIDWNLRARAVVKEGMNIRHAGLMRPTGSPRDWRKYAPGDAHNDTGAQAHLRLLAVTALLVMAPLGAGAEAPGPEASRCLAQLHSSLDLDRLSAEPGPGGRYRGRRSFLSTRQTAGFSVMSASSPSTRENNSKTSRPHGPLCRARHSEGLTVRRHGRGSAGRVHQRRPDVDLCRPRHVRGRLQDTSPDELSRTGTPNDPSSARHPGRVISPGGHRPRDSARGDLRQCGLDRRSDP